MLLSTAGEIDPYSGRWLSTSKRVCGQAIKLRMASWKRIKTYADEITS
jgi:hypothetical protein